MVFTRSGSILPDNPKIAITFLAIDFLAVQLLYIDNEFAKTVISTIFDLSVNER